MPLTGVVSVAEPLVGFSNPNVMLIVPLALAIAHELHASPYLFAMIVALAASCAFMTPISPVNTLVATAGNDRFSDFVRVRPPFSLIALVVSVPLVPMVLPLS